MGGCINMYVCSLFTLFFLNPPSCCRRLVSGIIPAWLQYLALKTHGFGTSKSSLTMQLDLIASFLVLLTSIFTWRTQSLKWFKDDTFQQSNMAGNFPFPIIGTYIYIYIYAGFSMAMLTGGHLIILIHNAACSDAQFSSFSQHKIER